MGGDTPPLPRDLRRLVEPHSSGADYVFITLNPAALALLLAHPRPRIVVESMRASGRIGDALADELTARIERSRRP